MILTAYNRDVQTYFNGSECTTINKNSILSTLEEKVYKMGKSFSKLFPNKRLEVLDEILFLLSGRGICKIGADKLAEKVGTSTRTVYSAVKSIKETNEILVCRLADGNVGKYIFVLKSHPNFKEILKEVFHMDSLPSELNESPTEKPSISEPVSQHVSEPVSGLENAETVDTTSVEGENSSSNYNNSFNSFSSLKHEINNYISIAIENEIIEAEKNKDIERVESYLKTPLEMAFYKQTIMFHNDIPAIRNNSALFVLRASLISDKIHTGAYFGALNKLNTAICNGVSIDSVVNYFEKLYRVEMGTFQIEREKAELNQMAQKTRTVGFYNWLEERE